MKKSLFLYLFILTLLFTVFTYMFLTKQVKFEQDRYAKTTTKLRDSIQLLTTKLADANYFSLERTLCTVTCMKMMVLQTEGECGAPTRHGGDKTRICRDAARPLDRVSRAAQVRLFHSSISPF